MLTLLYFFARSSAILVSLIIKKLIKPLTLH